MNRPSSRLFQKIIGWLPAFLLVAEPLFTQPTTVADGSGGLWINRPAGLFRVDSTGRAQYISLAVGDSLVVSNSIISAICRLPDSQTCLATQGAGLFIFDEKTGGVSRFNHSPNVLASLPSDSISALLFDGDLWLITPVGLSKWLAPLNIFRTFRPENEAAEFQKTTAILADTSIRNRLWLVGPTGLFSFDKKEGRFEFFPISEKPEPPLVLPTKGPLISEESIQAAEKADTPTSPFWKKWGGWLVLLVGVLAAARVGWQLLVARIRRQEILKHHIEDVENQLLRTRMNPHFIFNSLNSIRNHILSNDKILAADYLGGFALLMRNILEHSRSERIPLRDELDTLRLYVSLEQLRFQKKFDFDLRIDPVISQDDILVQPLLLQPFVENSIRHGLQNREGKGHLSVEIIRQNGSLIYRVEDDGPARARSQAIKAAAMSQADELQITRDRLLLHQHDATIEWVDLTDEKTEKTGTRIEVKMKLIE